MADTSFDPSDPSGITGRLAYWIHDLDLAAVPDDIVTRAKHILLDGLGCALVASHLPWSETAAKGIFSMEPGGGPCTVFGWPSKKISPVGAATLNSAFVQGFELDDYHSRAPVHGVSAIAPALFAAAELIGAEITGLTSADSKRSPLDGKAFLTAFIVGLEVSPRIGAALHGGDLLSRGWHSGAIMGPGGAAAAVSSLLALTPRQTEWALGTASTQSAGLMSAQFGAMAKRMQHGFAARSGLVAAMLARAEYSGIEAVYETPYGGFLSCFSAGASVEPKSLPDELVAGLGEKWEIEDVRIKLHAAMAVLHGTIDCVARLQQAHPERFKDPLAGVDSIVTQHALPAFEHGGWALPPPETPISSTAAQMSIQYAAAAQLLDGEVLMSQYGAAKMGRPELRQLAARVKPTHNEKFDKEKRMQWRTVVTVRLKDGTELEEAVGAPRGIMPPVTNDEIVDKWRRLTRDVLDDERRQKVESLILRLESLEDVRELTDLLGAEARCPIDVVRVSK